MNRIIRMLAACAIAGTFVPAGLAEADGSPPLPSKPEPPTTIAAAELTVSGWQTVSVTHAGGQSLVRGYFRVGNIGNIQAPRLVVVRVGLSGTRTSFYSLPWTPSSTPPRVGETAARTVAVPTTIEPGSSIRVDVVVKVECFATLTVDVDFTNVVWEQREDNNRSNLSLSAFCVE